MIKFLFCLLFAAAVVAANPYVVTYLSEVGVDPAYQFVELHAAPDGQPFDLTNWRLVTSSSACTLTCWLGYDEYVLIDSFWLAVGEVGHGTLRLNPLGDSVVLITDSGPIADVVHYPRYPTGHDSAPLPPVTGSIAYWSSDERFGQSENWYVDSTPTPWDQNDDYSAIAGSVTGVGGDTLETVYVVANGERGHCYCDLQYWTTNYNIEGLGAGKYEVMGYAQYQGEWYEGMYPESVSVGYSQTTSGIDIVIPLSGVTEAPPVAGDWLSLVTGPPWSCRVHSERPAFVTVTIHDHLGRVALKRGLSVRPGTTEVPLHSLAAGVYFINCTSGQTTIRKKHVMPY